MNDIEETPQQTIARLTAELAAANKTLSEMAEAKAQAEADEPIIEQKMKVGLTREQAIAVIKRQREHDAANGGKTK